MFHAELADVALFEAIPRYGDMAIHAALDLRRSYRREELESAVAATIADFPVLGRCYEPRLWRDRWRPVDAPLSEAVHVLDRVLDRADDLERETEAWVRRPIVVTRDRQIRVVQLPRPGGSRLLLSVMHLAVDGAGAAAVGHVFGAHLHGHRRTLPVDARRSVGAALEGLRWYHLPRLARDVAASLAQPARTFASARRARGFAKNGTRVSHWRWMHVGGGDLERLKARCGERGATVNDALVAALGRVSAARTSDDGPLTVLYTMDLRRYAGRPRLSAANTSSILTVQLPRRAVSDLARAAGAVAEITRRHRSGLIGPAFLVAPHLLGAVAPHVLARRLVRGLFPLMVDMPMRRGLLVTNVGRIDHGLAAFGEVLEDVNVIGPNIEGIDVPAIVAYGFRGELRLHLFAPPGLAKEALDELENELRAALELA